MEARTITEELRRWNDTLTCAEKQHPRNSDGSCAVCETSPEARTHKRCEHSNTTEEPANFDGVGAGLSGARFVTVCWDCGEAIGDAHRL